MLKFIYGNSELEVNDLDDEEIYHSSNVSCVRFGGYDEAGVLRCATGSFDRLINLYKITGFGEPGFSCKENISLFTRMK